MSDWKFVRSLSEEGAHLLMHRHSETGIIRETRTPCSGDGDYTSRAWGKPQVVYYHPDDPETHDTYDDALTFAEEGYE